MSNETVKKIERPLSPHLQVYRPQMTSVLSILHRACGYALAVGAIMVIWMLVAGASGFGAFETFTDFVGSLPGKVIVFGWSVAFFYHLSNGVRHLIWDTGRLFKIENAYRAGYIVLASTVILTALFWCAVWGGNL